MNWIDSIATALSDGPGYIVLPEFHPTTELLADFESQRPRFRRAGVGRAQGLTQNDEIRRDETLWFDPSSMTPAQAAFWARLEELRIGLNERLYLGLWNLEGHYAFYPAGGFYKKHLDRFASSSARTVSLVFYMNAHWQPGDGGELLIYDGEKVAAKVEPRAGTLVCFLSDRIEHEVSTSRQDRRSFAGWFRRRDL